MYRLSRLENAEDVPHVHDNTFAEQATPSRIIAAPSAGHFSLLFHLAEGLPGPFAALWVLRVSRGRADQGRYQSPFLALAELLAALEPFRSFLSEDGRSQLWLHSPEAGATLVWDQHDLLYLYGPLESFRTALVRAGLREAEPVVISFPHGHHYHPAFDDAEESMASLFEWCVTPLRPDD
jgi:hypothetical protein